MLLLLYNDNTYEGILKSLADHCLNEDYLKSLEKPKQGSIYSCGGSFEWKDNSEDDIEDDNWEN